MADKSKAQLTGLTTLANKRWLREASMKRLNMLIKNKKETIGDDFLCADISADDLESSGLSAIDRFHLNKWADGLESGRHCMLALLENRASVENDQMKNANGKGLFVGSLQQRPLEMTMLSATISLPEEFLCDSGYLYESIFSRAPGAVVREAMQLLAVKAFEKSSATLRIDQINLALKQLRVEKMTANVTSTNISEKEEKSRKSVAVTEQEVENDFCDKDKENLSNGSTSTSSRTSPAFGTADASDPAKATPTPLTGGLAGGDTPPLSVSPPPPSEKRKISVTEVGGGTVVDKEIELFRLQIITEMIRMHILAGKKTAALVASNAAAADRSAVTAAASSSSSSVRHSPQSAAADASNASATSGKENDKEKGVGKEGRRGSGMDVDTIEQHLDSSLQAVEAIAEAQDPLSLEESNIRLKPYLRQLNALKASLSCQLRELEDSRAFIALGISKEATEAMIKKAYHSKAIKLHPDKPGGDTAKFQQLQASYQEILKKKAEAAATEKEMNGDEDEDVSEGAEERSKKKGAAEEERERVAGVIYGLGEVLEQVKEAADQCARIGQLAIKWQKRVDRASRQPYPEDLNLLYKILKDTDSKRRKGDRDREKDRESREKREEEEPFVLECSAKLAIVPLEKICELMQLLSSLAMELPSCGFRYGLAIAGNSNYMKVVESAMSSGLDAIKSVGALLSAEQQLNSCLNRIKEAKRYILDFEKGDKEGRVENEGKKEVRVILVQMILSAFRGNSATVGIAAERAVSAVFIASELYGIASGVVQQAGEDRKTEAKKSVARKEEEREMCHEDREILKEKKAQERDEDTKRFLAEEKRRDDERKKEKEEEGSDSLEKLRLKIKSLQVQLRVQNVQTLQSLNGETRALQRKLQHQLKELMLLSLGETEHVPVPSTPIPSSSSSSSSLPPFRVSLLSLLADFIDSSCNELRADLQDTEANMDAFMSSAKTESKGDASGLGSGVSTGVGAIVSDTDSDSSYELISSLNLDEDSSVPLRGKEGDKERDESAISAVALAAMSSSRCNRISASIDTHLGWMRDLRGEKTPARNSSPLDTGEKGTPTDTGVGTPAESPASPEDTTEGEKEEALIEEECSEGCWRSQCSGTATPEGEGEKEQEGDDEVEGYEEGVSIDETSPFAPNNISPDKSNATSESKENFEVERNSAQEGAEEKVPVPPDTESEGTGGGDADKDRERAEVCVSRGVRLALLPDFRSKILWLAALVDAEGVVVIVREELQCRLQEIIDAALPLPLPAPLSMSLPSVPRPASPSCALESVPSTGGFCDAFCSVVIRGVRSAAAPHTEAK